MANDDLKNKWQPCIRHAKHITAGQATVLAETGVGGPADRAFSHMGIETGYTGDPKLKSRGVNQCCPKPGQDCTPDCRAWGLFQIYWPPFRGVDWQRLFDPAYNCYVGLKTLAIYYQQCGSWPGASNKFFTGVACDPIGVEDGSTGTDDSEYRKAMERNMRELNTLGIGQAVTGGGTDANPKPPKGSTPDGGTNTPGEKCIPGTPICVDPSAILNAQLEQYAGRALVFILGAALLLIGAWRLAR